MIVTLTSFNGNVKKINLPNAEAVKTFLVELPTWLLVGSIALVYSIRLIRNDK